MAFRDLRSTEFHFGANCSPPTNLAGGFVSGTTASARAVVRAEKLYCAYHEMSDIDTEREGYYTPYQYPAEQYQAHVRQNHTPKGYAGPAACPRLYWDIDRASDLSAALEATRKLVSWLRNRYDEHAFQGLGVYFSGAKGFHVTLVAMPGFAPFVHVPQVVKGLCMAIAEKASVAVDPAVYDRQRLFRLPNTRHPKTGLYKRFLEFKELHELNATRVREVAAHPAGYAVPSVSEDCSVLADDWCAIEDGVLARGGEVTPSVSRSGVEQQPVVPKFVRDFIAFGDAQNPGRAVTLFRAAAALAEGGTPYAVIVGLLEEPALKIGMVPAEVGRQILCGYEYGLRTKEAGTCRPR